MTFFPTFALLRAKDVTRHYIFLQDWPYDLAQPSPQDRSLERLMDNWKRAGLAKDSILSCADIVSEHPEFTLLTDASRDRWLKDRLLTEPSLKVQALSSDNEWHPVKVWTVRHEGAKPVCQ